MVVAPWWHSCRYDCNQSHGRCAGEDASCMITHDSRWRWLSYTMAGVGQCQEEVPAAYSPGAPAADGSPGASQHAGRQSRPVAAGCWWESGSTITSVWKRHLTIRCPVFPLANSRDVPLFHAYPYMRDPEIVAQIVSPCAVSRDWRPWSSFPVVSLGNPAFPATSGKNLPEPVRNPGKIPRNLATYATLWQGSA